MNISSIEFNGAASLAVRVEDEFVPLPDRFPSDFQALARAGEGAFEDAFAYARDAKQRIPAEHIKFLPLSTTQRKTICLGLNYHNHVEETGRTKPEFPMIFLRASTSLVAHQQPIIRPHCSDELDFEGELVAVIGRRARNVRVEDAHAYVLGYSIFNDASIRDYQRMTTQWTVGKNFDATGSFGPHLVLAKALPPGAAGLELKTILNGEVVQQANTEDMIFNVAESIALLSKCMTLEVGDVLVMGTPGGVGAMRSPKLFMKPGDICQVYIEGIGMLTNHIAHESN